MVKVIWTESAIQDLSDIGDFIAKDSVRYAELTVSKLFYSTDILENHPKAGKKIPEINDESFREIIRGNFRIVYHSNIY
ncbi:MAG: type II toxin-antitoxin system RelE/ParE family toxin [Bacteroidales bacterium]|nr:type II toxin-antitoxin system RelE/ParE family toxin [Bacteroidales bacterium]